MRTYLIFGIIITLLLTGCGKQKRESVRAIEIPELEHLAIEINPQQSRPFVFTNKAAAFYYGETGRIRSDSHMGFYVMTQRILDDYLTALDGHFLERHRADSVRAYPDHILRLYPGKLQEMLYLLDNLNCLVIEFSAPDVRSLEITPIMPALLDLDHAQIRWNRNRDLLVIKSEAKAGSSQQVPVIGFKFDVPAQFDTGTPELPENLIPAKLIGHFRLTTHHGRFYLLAAESENELLQLSDYVVNNVVRLVDEKRKRLIQLLGDCHFETNIPALNKAFRWAVISMDQLIMRQPGAGKDIVGIFAGLPWFNNYWGRDTFISFPGAVLVRGDFETSRQILTAFAQFQNQDSKDPNYGRIPNQITTEQISYNTADGTPWFVRALWDYYRYSGDRVTLESLYPVVKRAIEGTLKYHCDAQRFLTHGPAETWMDAQGPDGPWSPRGNRAVEVQALWYQQLICSANMAHELGKNADAETWKQLADELKENFQNRFWNNSRSALFDHLKENDEPDRKIRPNQILAITVPQEIALLPAEREFSVMKEVVTQLTYSYGVASLWQHDPDFHPYHQYPKYYPKDAAYHNGTVWGWLAGPVVSSMLKYGYQNLAIELLLSECNQILNHGAVGTLSELLNAIPDPGKELPEPSGAVSQAWSLAEFIRNISQDLIGIHPDVPNRKIRISPHLPDNITSLTCCVPIPNSEMHLTMRQDDLKLELVINYLKDAHPWDIEIDYLVDPTRKINFKFAIRPETTKMVQINFEPLSVSIDGEQIGYRLDRIPIRSELLNFFTFAVPQLDKNLNYLKPPAYPLLSGHQVKSWNNKARKLFDLEAPKNDDRGPNKKYVYPTASYFKDGIFDLTHFKLLLDEHNYYFELKFRNLVQPGWNPEYGFQLTFVAIAIDQGTDMPGTRWIGRNANLQLPRDYTCQKIIYVGGGLQIEDGEGNILAAYRADDPKYPLGNVEDKTISFAIPQSFLGKYNQKWRIVIAVGGQDDHGGAGLGEFRAVGKTASQWQGGGGEQETGNCNVYDLFLVK
ncbi:MAG: GH116 family glycosyl hydrolase [candidate division KSB1 bacterium]|nr:GH116 family glycosyl hydrolase [candidate division KSB1 bacterium]MDZ7335336.1 GH116 family glycosyl hydrolase [candidate division KSB1 bacterium]MDZ7356809.1 GH116 family glycosyl hydrolase [candidate division KSB1 bacterium]MDZ7399022.1 GH116 family glycosyl hydrolase [candidate division KSB1 bacterium]